MLGPDELLAQGFISFAELRNAPLKPTWFNFYGWNKEEVGDIDYITRTGLFFFIFYKYLYYFFHFLFENKYFFKRNAFFFSCFFFQLLFIFFFSKFQIHNFSR